MIPTRKEVRRRKEVRGWLVFPALFALSAATAVLAEVTVNTVGSADATDHLFRNVADPGANARPFDGTVTETASQTDMIARIERADAAAARSALASRASSGTVTQPAGGPRSQEPEVRASSLPPAAPRSASDPAAGPRRVEFRNLRELRRLREEIRALEAMVTALETPRRPSRVLQPAVLRAAR